MNVNLTALRTELTTDPLALGYPAAVQAGDDAALAALINSSPRTVPAKDVFASVVRAALDPDEMATMTNGDLQRLHSLLAPGFVAVQTANIRAEFQALFPQLTRPKSRAALALLVNRAGTRVEELFGDGATVTSADVALALRGVDVGGVLKMIGREERILADPSFVSGWARVVIETHPATGVETEIIRTALAPADVPFFSMSRAG